MTKMNSAAIASRKAADPLANRLLALLPPEIMSGFARTFIEFRWSTGSLSSVRTSPSDLSISSRRVSVRW